MSDLRGLCILVAVTWLLGSVHALAQPKPAAPAGQAQPKPAAPVKAASGNAAVNARTETLTIARDKLARADDASVQQALSSLATLGGEPAAQLVIARLRLGLPPQLAEAAIDTLVLLNRPSAAAALLEQALHSRAAIRLRAITALGALRVRAAQSALLFALDDPDPQVRAAAVASLGTVGDARALSALYVAAERGITGAFTSIGMIAKSSDVKGLLAHAPNADVTVIKPALLAIMERKDFPIEGKVRIVQELAKLGSPSVRACLVQWLDAYKTVAPANLRKALFDAIKRLDDLDKAKEKIVVETTGGKS